MHAEEQPVVFPCCGDELLGIIHKPSEPRSTGVIIVVGGPQYRVGSHRQFLLLARYLAEQGIPVMRFDYRGMGDSSGDIRAFDSVNDDIAAATNMLCRAFPEITNVVLWGLCDAASASLFYAHRDSRIRGLVLLNPWVRTEAGEAKAYLKNYYIQRLFNKQYWQRLLRGEISIRESLKSITRLLQSASGGMARVIPGGKNDLAPLPDLMLQGLMAYSGRILFVLSGDDLSADEFRNLVKSSRAWKNALSKSAVEFKELRQANHTFSSYEWRANVQEWTLEWIKEFD